MQAFRFFRHDMSHKIDLIEELKLRQWARRNYVEPSLRDPSWHPIVHLEMEVRDLEQRDSAPASLAAGLVPLEDRRIRIDAAHTSRADFAITPPRSRDHHQLS